MAAEALERGIWSGVVLFGKAYRHSRSRQDGPSLVTEGSRHARESARH